MGFYGVSENEGETEPAMVKILEKWQGAGNQGEVGCSIIPDCESQGKMFVVVSCIREVWKEWIPGSQGSRTSSHSCSKKRCQSKKGCQSQKRCQPKERCQPKKRCQSNER